MQHRERDEGEVAAGELRALFETMPIGVVYQAADGRITHANPAAERILGLSLDQMQGRTSIDPRWRSVRRDGSDFPGDEHPAMVALQTGEPVNGVVMGVYNPVTEEQRWIRVDATPLFDPGEAAPREVYTTFLDITAETLAREASLADEARFRRLFEAMNEGVAYCRMLYDEDGGPDDFVYESVNPAFARLTGLEDVVGRRVTEIIPDIKREAPDLIETYGRVARTGEAAEFDIDFTPLDMYLHIKVYGPEPDHFVAVFENVTEHRRMISALQESDQRLRSIMDTMHVGCQIVDRDGRYVYLNAAAETHARRTAAELVGMRMADAYPGIESTEVYRRIETCMEAGADSRFENEFVYPDGSRGWYDLVIQPVPEGVLVQSLDITERILTHAALRESEAIRDTAERIARVGSWRYDPSTQLASWSPEMFEIFGVERTGQSAGWEPVDFAGILATRVHIDDRAAVSEATAEIVIRGGHGVVEFRLASPDGTWRVLHGEGSAETDGDGRVISISGYYQDVTEQRAAEARIRQLNEDLEQRVAARTAELARATQELQGFVYSISHDLRTPLRTIGSYSQILLQDHGADLDDDGKDALRRIERANARMVRLVDGLLELAGLARSSLQVQDVDVSRVAREVAEELRDGDPDRDVDFTVADGLTARADEALLRVVFYDLLGNAWKFTAGRRPARIEVGALRQDGAVAFFVRDDGAGFDPRYADKLFLPFERLHDDAEFKGTGIGLATVRRIVERHGGRVWAEGEVGAGATFYFTLP